MTTGALPDGWEVVYDEQGEPCGHAHSISTQQVDLVPAPPDHPARADEPGLLVPKPGDLVLATELPRHPWR